MGMTDMSVFIFVWIFIFIAFVFAIILMYLDDKVGREVEYYEAQGRKRAGMARNAGKRKHKAKG